MVKLYFKGDVGKPYAAGGFINSDVIIIGGVFTAEQNPTDVSICNCQRFWRNCQVLLPPQMAISFNGNVTLTDDTPQHGCFPVKGKYRIQRTLNGETNITTCGWLPVPIYL